MIEHHHTPTPPPMQVLGDLWDLAAEGRLGDDELTERQLADRAASDEARARYAERLDARIVTRRGKYTSGKKEFKQITEADRASMIRRFAAGESKVALARAFGVGHKRVAAVVGQPYRSQRDIRSPNPYRNGGAVLPAGDLRAAMTKGEGA